MKKKIRKPPLNPVQWIAGRALAEGELPTREAIAAALGVDLSAVYFRSRQERWRTPDFRLKAVREAYDKALRIARRATARAEPVPDSEMQAPWVEDPKALRFGVGGADESEFAATETRAGQEPGRDDQAGAAGGRPSDEMVDGTERIEPVATGSAAEAGILEQGTADLLKNAVAFVSRQLTRLFADADRDGEMDKGQVDALVSLSRVLERWEARLSEQATQDATRREDDLAATLARANERIVELARGYATYLGAGRCERCGA